MGSFWVSLIARRIAGLASEEGLSVSTGRKCADILEESDASWGFVDEFKEDMIDGTIEDEAMDVNELKIEVITLDETSKLLGRTRDEKRYAADDPLSGLTVVDLSNWLCFCPKDIPEQKNGFDCGVFICKFAECVSRGGQFDFTQQQMAGIRKEMAKEILGGELNIYLRPEEAAAQLELLPMCPQQTGQLKITLHQTPSTCFPLRKMSVLTTAHVRNLPRHQVARIMNSGMSIINQIRSALDPVSGRSLVQLLIRGLSVEELRSLSAEDLLALPRDVYLKIYDKINGS
uniref:Ubiquitin-like protease family profile domain-containing protein n=1 Tax=Ditylenchus dipsaci TaxID=166011 RepID=A0A915E6W9_9BILA